MRKKHRQRSAINTAADAAGVNGQPDADAIRQSDSVEYLNIGMMVAALVVAAVVPFELFLVSYAVLGPLHYLTEISWLHDRKFFTSRQADWLPLVFCGLLITLGNDAVLGLRGQQWLDAVSLSDTSLHQVLKSWKTEFTFVAFGIALVLVVTRQVGLRLLGVALLVIGAYLLHESEPRPVVVLYDKLFGVYLPTLIHVFVFTGAFILAGALKRHSRAGLFSFAIFLACGALALWLPNLSPTSLTESPAVFWRTFPELALTSLQDLLGQTPESFLGTNVFANHYVLRLVRFLAFAYTYHYLNWFSKTSIIQWHAVSPVRLTFLGLAWLASVVLYAIRYDVGLRWLFLLSLTHVLLEFPLNHKSFLSIAGAVRQRWGSA